MSQQKSVLMVCPNNICRSPLAEGAFLHLLKEKKLHSKWKVDSAAVAGDHIGKPAKVRSLLTMKKHGISYNRKARQVTKSDFNEFDFIFGMDKKHIPDLKNMAPQNCKAIIGLLSDYDPQGEQSIVDPYDHSGSEGFEKCYQQCVRCCTAFLDQHS